MVKELLKWTDKKMEDVCNDPNESHGFAKAFGLGALEGAIDAVAVLGTVGLLGCIVATFKK